MSLLSLSNYKSSRYNPYYLKLLPVASRERPPQAKEFEDIQDIIINPINKYTLYNFNDYEILSGIQVINITNNSITLSSGRLLLNNFPVIVETLQETLTSNLTSYTIYIVIDITEEDNKYIASYKFNTEDGYPLFQVTDGKYISLYRNKNKDYITQQLFEIYGNFISSGLVFNNGCISPGVAYIAGNKVTFSYHTAIITSLQTYRIIIRDKDFVVIDTKTKLDPITEMEIGVYSNGTWTPALYNKQIKNKDIILLENNLNKLRDYLLETSLLQSIDTTSNILTDTFVNTNNADTTNPLFNCDIESGNLLLGTFSRVTKNVVINNVNTNTKIINNVPNVIIQDYTSQTIIDQPTQTSFITLGISSKGILKLGPTRLDTSIYSSSVDSLTLLSQTVINAEAYGLTANASDFRLTVGSVLVTTPITTDDKGTASFSFKLPTGASINDVITIENNTSSATSSLSNTYYPIDTTYIGQVISITNDNTTLVGGSIYIRKVNTTSPLLKIMLTKFTTGPQEVLGQAVINNNQIRTSEDGSLATPFTWDLPITLSKGTYCFIISSINSPTDLFISSSATLNNSYLFSSDAKQIGITTYLNQDLKFKLDTAIYVSQFVPTTLTISDNINTFDHLFYPGKFNINNIEYTNETDVNSTNSVGIVLNVNKYAFVDSVLVSTRNTEAVYISKTIRTNFKYSNIYFEMDAIILDSTTVKVFLSSNEGYSWEELTSPTSYLIDGNDQTFKYIYNMSLTELVSIINRDGNVTDATRNYLTIKIDLATQSNNKPIVKGYKSYVS